MPQPKANYQVLTLDELLQMLADDDGMLPVRDVDYPDGCDDPDCIFCNPKGDIAKALKLED